MCVIVLLVLLHAMRSCFLCAAVSFARDGLRITLRHVRVTVFFLGTRKIAKSGY